MPLAVRLDLVLSHLATRLSRSQSWHPAGRGPTAPQDGLAVRALERRAADVNREQLLARCGVGPPAAGDGIP